MHVTGVKVVMRAPSEDKLEIDLMNEIYHDENEAWWMGGTTAKEFLAQLPKDKIPKDITVRINSNGGSVSDGVTMYNGLRDLARKGARITTVNMGMAASIASVVLMAGDVRRAATGSRTMIHNAGIAGRVPYMNSADMRKLADELEQINGSIAEIYAKASNGKKSKEDFLALMAEETTLNASEAVDHGLATENDPELQAVAWVNDSHAVVACRTGAAVCPGPAATPTNPTTTEQETTMKITKEQVLADAPEVANALRQEGRDQAASELTASALNRARDVLALKAALPGHDAAIEAMAFDGKTTVEQAKARIFDAEAETRRAALNVLQAPNPPAGSVPAPAAPANHAGQVAPSVEDKSLPIEERAKKDWDASASLQKEFDCFDSYLAYVKGIESGRVTLTNRKEA